MAEGEGGANKHVSLRDACERAFSQEPVEGSRSSPDGSATGSENGGSVRSLVAGFNCGAEGGVERAVAQARLVAAVAPVVAVAREVVPMDGLGTLRKSP